MRKKKEREINIKDERVRERERWMREINKAERKNERDREKVCA